MTATTLSVLLLALLVKGSFSYFMQAPELRAVPDFQFDFRTLKSIVEPLTSPFQIPQNVYDYIYSADDQVKEFARLLGRLDETKRVTIVADVQDVLQQEGMDDLRAVRLVVDRLGLPYPINVTARDEAIYRALISEGFPQHQASDLTIILFKYREGMSVMIGLITKKLKERFQATGVVLAPPTAVGKTVNFNSLLDVVKKSPPGYIPDELHDFANRTKKAPAEFAGVMRNMTVEQLDKLPNTLYTLSRELGINVTTAQQNLDELSHAYGGQLIDAYNNTKKIYASMMDNGIPALQTFGVIDTLLKYPVISRTLPFFMDKLKEMTIGNLRDNTVGCDPVDCVYSAYSGWMPCNGGLEMRVRQVLQPAKCNGRCDGYTLDTRVC